MKEIAKYFEDNNITITEDEVDKITAYVNEVLSVGKNMNLTADLSKEKFIAKHVIDSIYGGRFIDFKENAKSVDIGTGAGLPGMIVAILNPTVNFTLLDSLKKRITFLEETCDKIGIHNVFTVADRAEEFGRNSSYREVFDVSFSRAVASLNVLLEYAVPTLVVGGHFYAFKSLKCDEELEAAKNAMEALKVELFGKYEYRLPTGEYRVVLDFVKNGKTEDKYPRRNGKPSKRPL